MFAGPLMPDAAYNRLQSLAQEADNVKLTRFTADLAVLLRRAELSVSMAGYNTMMDVLSSGVRAMVYPVTSNEDQEQIVRADRLAKDGIIEVICTEELAPEQLAHKLECALGKKSALLSLNFDGAANTVRILKKFLAAHSERALDTPQTVPWPREANNTRSRVSGSGAAGHVK
jgi:predicted glycosyltransferase